MDVVGDGAIWDEFVGEEEFTAVAGGAAIESDEILMAEEGEDLDFVHELLQPSVVVLVKPFHGYDSAVFKLACNMNASIW